MHGVAWRDVPTWAASVLTGGPLLLAFTILLRDRWRMDREQIDQFAFWVEAKRAMIIQPGILIHVKNASVLPVKGVTIGAYANVHYDGSAFIAKVAGERAWDVLDPGVSDDHEFSFSLAQQAAYSGINLNPDKVKIDYVAARPEYAHGQEQVRENARRAAAVMVGNSAASRLAHLRPELALLRGAGLDQPRPTALGLESLCAYAWRRPGGGGVGRVCRCPYMPARCLC